MTAPEPRSRLRIDRETVRRLLDDGLDGSISDGIREHLVTRILLAVALESLRANLDVLVDGKTSARTLQALTKTARKARGQLVTTPEGKLLTKALSDSHGSPAASREPQNLSRSDILVT